ncbi:DUF6527 family protein [Flavobacterium sp. C3NV]|uniref:DUF6527 family protein n=1 Tax=Flavobacterium sp. C3NV TaxID=3393358 RepID=UPI003990132B
MSTISLKLITHLPIKLDANVLYVSEEFEIAGHLCPCGCESKIITPLGINEWSLSVIEEKPTLKPSIGNWQLPCQSHYWIRRGEILWSNKWSDEEIEAGRLAEEQQRKEYYDEMERTVTYQISRWERLKKWFSKILRDML